MNTHEYDGVSIGGWEWAPLPLLQYYSCIQKRGETPLWQTDQRIRSTINNITTFWSTLGYTHPIVFVRI
ncbi:Uncharacterized protein HZ326_21420 [Fusarium oxysporum f. sp. albedinis]|nr:Uncharacterized protein HZ326_21420 [Fusarium oxysporum f. sp. albedinis]